MITTITISKVVYDEPTDAFYVTPSSFTVTTPDTIDIACIGNNDVAISIIIPYYDA